MCGEKRFNRIEVIRDLMVEKRGKLVIAVICAGLAILTATVFEGVRLHEFVDYDDYEYVVENRQVQAGITGASIKWAFTSTHASNWHPVTWLSHMLDCELFGLDSGRHHLTNLLFHVLNTLILFWVLRRASGSAWASGFVAAVFAIHPLHVESVAWVAERKDVLSTFFWMLTMAAYVRYAERPSVGRYVPVFIGLGVGLMAKPMLVTLPFVLVLLDYWPLERFGTINQSEADNLVHGGGGKSRFQRASLRHLISEKIPLFVLSAVSSVITFIVQQRTGAMKWGESFSLGVRVSNAAVSYVGYIFKTFWPKGLAVLYPHKGHSLETWQPIGALLVLGILSAGIFYLGRRRRYLLVGWLWYLGTLVPVTGVVQVGAQAMADRYTYVPLVGIFILVAWGAGEFFGRWRAGRIGLGIAGGVVLAALLICGRIEVRYWRNDLSLFGRTLRITERNYIIHNYYGRALRRKGRLEEAIGEIREAIRLNPNYFEAYNSLGITLKAQGKIYEATVQFRKSLELNPNYERARNNLGIMLASRGDLDGAIGHFIKVIELNTKSDKAHHNLAQAFYSKGEIGGAIRHYRESLRLGGDSVETLGGLSWILATSKDAAFRNGTEAVGLAARACELSGYRDPEVLYTLAAAYAETGRFSEAASVARQAIDLCMSVGKEERAKVIERALRLFEAGKAYRR